MNGQTARAAIHISAIFALYLSMAMLIPAAVDLYHGNDDWQVFALSAFFQGGLALAMALATRGRPPPATPRFGFLVLNLLWLTLACRRRAAAGRLVDQHDLCGRAVRICVGHHDDRRHRHQPDWTSRRRAFCCGGRS
jgi:hypothetical protein